MANYFCMADYQALKADKSSDQPVYTKMLDLHKTVYTKIRNHQFFIHPYTHNTAVINFSSAACPAENDMLTITYSRPDSEADLVQRLMNNNIHANGEASREARLHPVIELRLTADGFAVELILSPAARWDQQNFVGKLSSPRQRLAFYKLLYEMDGDYRIGFWSGSTLSEMHVTTGQLAWTRALDQWMNTFEEGQDWFRVGFWYQAEDEALDETQIAQEVFKRVQSLYQIYNFLAWSSNNDFHKLYHKKQAVAAYA